MAAEYVFGDFRLDAQERRLTRGNEVIHLEPKSFDLLHYLIDRPGKLIKKQSLVDAVWSQAVVTDNSLTRCVHQVRTALGDDAESPAYIETVPGSGYRFIGPVKLTDDPAPESSEIRPPRRISWNTLPIVLMLLIAVSSVVWITFEATRIADPQIQRIAVLPLANLTGDPDQLYFVHGIHEALIAELGRIEKMDIISKTSVMRFQDTEITIPEIAEQLRVDAVVEGSVSRAGDSLTVTAQLIATTPERHLWAERFHRNVADVFEITTEIAKSIAAEIAINLSAAEETHFSTIRRVDADAYDAYLLGRFHLEKRSREGYEKANRQFQRAVDIDPTFAPAFIGLADTIGSAAVFGMRKPADAYPQALSLAEKAIRLDSTLSEAHMTLAAVKFYWDWNWTAAEDGVRRALGLNPNSAESRRFLAEILSVTGRHGDAMIEIERGRELDPLSPISQFKPVLILYLKRDYDEAIYRARTAIDFNPDFWQGHWLLCLSLSAVGQHADAMIACDEAAKISRRAPMALGALGFVYAQGGRPSDAEKIIAELHSLETKRYVGPAALAMIYGALGVDDLAFKAFERALEDRDQLLIHAENYGFFDPLRSDERFQNLSRTVSSGSR